jgi:hypothetical protein
MCDNLDVKGKRGVLWGSQSLNTVVGSCEPARDKLDSNITLLGHRYAHEAYEGLEMNEGLKEIY